MHNGNVRNHLILNGRDPSFRVWRGLGDRDSSYEEWEIECKKPIKHQNLEFDLQTNIRAMVEDVLQQVNEPMALEERIMEIVEEVFVVLDGLQKEANVGNASNSEDELPGNIEADHEPLKKVASKDAMP